MIDTASEMTSGAAVTSGGGQVSAASGHGGGAVAGAVSVVVFTVVHHVLISNIWPMLGVMLLAGAGCGWSIASSYGRLFPGYSIRTWLGYNLSYLMVFGALAVTSILLFEPVTTMAAISARGGPVDDLIRQAMPLSIGFTVVAAAVLGVAYGNVLSDYLRVLVTMSVLMLFVGLNVSVLGLVEFNGAPTTPVVTFFALVVLLDAVFAAGFAFLRRGEVNPL